MAVYVVLLGLWAVCWWFFFRICFGSIRKDISGAVFAFAVTGTFLPFVGVLVGFWYLIWGPTRKRVHAQIRAVIASLPDAPLVDSIDQQIAASQQTYPWVEEKWSGLSHQGKVELINRIRIQFNDIALEHGVLSKDRRFVIFDLVAAAALATELSRQQAAIE
jgi:hypothetical protein